MNKFFTLFLTLFLVACNTTVISDEDRALPESDKAMEDDAMMEEEVEDDAMMEEDDHEDEDEHGHDHEDDEQDESDDEDEQETLKADLSQSFIAFTGSKGSLSSHEGKFNDFDLTLLRQGETVESVEVSIDIASMETDSDGLTKHLLADDYFHAEAFPTATFVSSGVERNDSDLYEITGTLTIHGVSNEVTLTADITKEYMLLQYVLDRTVYGVGPAPEGVKAIDAEVPLEVKIVFTKIAPKS